MQNSILVNLNRRKKHTAMRCEFCESIITPKNRICPNCGAPNPFYGKTPILQKQGNRSKPQTSSTTSSQISQNAETPSLSTVTTKSTGVNMMLWGLILFTCGIGVFLLIIAGIQGYLYLRLHESETTSTGRSEARITQGVGIMLAILLAGCKFYTMFNC